jgi:hypothetical protein
MNRNVFNIIDSAGLIHRYYSRKSTTRFVFETYQLSRILSQDSLLCKTFDNNLQRERLNYHIK